MKPEVIERWLPFNKPLEGWLTFMYLDMHEPDGLVTTGMGNLVDPVSLALALPWKHRDGTLATDAEITAQWRFVKAQQSMKRRGGVAYGPLTTLRLTEEDVRSLVSNKLAEMEREIARLGWFKAWDALPWQAQMVVMSMSWAAGPGVFRGFPRFRAAINGGDWMTASAECKLREDTRGIAHRNARNRELLEELSIPVDDEPPPDAA